MKEKSYSNVKIVVLTFLKFEKLRNNHMKMILKENQPFNFSICYTSLTKKVQLKSIFREKLCVKSHEKPNSTYVYQNLALTLSYSLYKQNCTMQMQRRKIVCP